jgi:hypothetical protein
MDCKQKEDTSLLKELKTEPALETILKLKINWIQRD